MTAKEVLSNLTNYDMWEYENYKLCKEEAKKIIELLELESRIGKECYSIWHYYVGEKWTYSKCKVEDMSIKGCVALEDGWYDIDDPDCPTFFEEEKAIEECARRNGKGNGNDSNTEQ